MRLYAAVAAGGIAGAWCRVALIAWLGPAGGGWPWATFVANLGGAFLLGYLATRLGERLAPGTYRRPLLANGFCGALTTFSTLQLELVQMLRHGRTVEALAYAMTSTGGCFAALLAAVWLVRRVRVTA